MKIQSTACAVYTLQNKREVIQHRLCVSYYKFQCAIFFPVFSNYCPSKRAASFETSNTSFCMVENFTVKSACVEICKAVWQVALWKKKTQSSFQRLLYRFATGFKSVVGFLQVFKMWASFNKVLQEFLNVARFLIFMVQFCVPLRDYGFVRLLKYTNV